MIPYILECIAFQLVFLIIYDFLLKRETFFQWNRLYLIGTYVLSLVLPWIKIEALKTAVPEKYYVYPEFLWNANDLSAPTTVSAEVSTITISWEEGILFGGMLLATLYFGYKLYQIHRLRKTGAVRHFPDFTQIIIENSELAFSFFRSIFLGDRITQREHGNIVRHELVHIEQRHSLDLLFFEIMRIVGWFNPLVYVYQNRISELHEFIADSKAAKTDKREQYEFLLSQIFQTGNISFVNQFFKTSLIKKRIAMLQRTKSKKIWQLKYLLLVPLVLGMLLYTSSEAQEKRESVQEQTPDDTTLIERLNTKIDKEVVRYGSIGKVHRNFSLKHGLDSPFERILSKEAYFERDLISEKHFSQYLDSIEKAETPFFRRNTVSKRPPPSTARYKSYVQHTKAFQILDKNLMYSISNNFQNGGTSIRLMDEDEVYPDYHIVFSVESVKDLTGIEVRAFNNKIDEVFEERTSEYSGLILTDNEYAFEIFETESWNDTGENRTERIDSEVIVVGDIANLTEEEQNTLFERLRNLSNASDDWQLFVKDKNGQLRFVPSEDGSYISGPNGERIHAKLAIDNKLNSQEASEFADLFEKMRRSKQDLTRYSDNGQAIGNGESTGSKGNLIIVDRYNQLVKERKRLLKSTDEKNPVIINLDKQLKGLRKSAFGDGETVPFAKVEEVPVFPGCENAEDKRDCFLKNMQRHISKNFRYPEEAQEKGIQGRVAILFTISETGTIDNLRLRGPHQLLEDEAERIILRLPSMKPGKHKGEPVNVPFSIPITFKLQDEKTESRAPLNLDVFQESTPLVVIDGEESTEAALNLINPADIASINVLKDDTAVTIYGENGRNGVMDIRTKNADSENKLDGIYKAYTNTMSVSVTADDENGSKLVSGTVTDGTMALPGATVSIRGQEKGVISDFKGKFMLKAEKGDIMVIQYIGLPIIEFAITDEKNYQETKRKR